MPDSSRTVRAIRGHEWGVSEQLLAAIFDVLNAANWQRGGGKGPRPKPLQRPGVDGPQAEEKRFGTPVSFEELDRRLHPEKYLAEVPDP